MNFKYIFILLVLVSTVLSQRPLVTRNKKGDYVPILNQNGRITNRYPGGIFVKRGNNRYAPVHKITERNWLRNDNARVII